MKKFTLCFLGATLATLVCCAYAADTKPQVPSGTVDAEDAADLGRALRMDESGYVKRPLLSDALMYQVYCLRAGDPLSVTPAIVIDRNTPGAGAIGKYIAVFEVRLLNEPTETRKGEITAKCIYSCELEVSECMAIKCARDAVLQVLYFDEPLHGLSYARPVRPAQKKPPGANSI